MHLSRSDIIVTLVTLLAVAIMGVSLTYSIQATRFEVYSLNFAGFAALVLVCQKIISRERPSILWSFILFVLLGLFLAVHNLTIALAIPGIILFMLWGKKITPGNAILGVIASFIFSGLFYVTLVFRAEHNPLINWGDPSNLGNLVDYILIKGFTTTTSRLAPSHFADQLGFAYDVLYKQLGPAALALSAFGLGYVVVRKREIGIPLVVLFGFNILSVAFAENYFYENYDLHGYLMIALAVLTVGLAVALAIIYDLVMSRLRGRRAGIARYLAVGVFFIFAMLVTAPPVRDNYRAADLSHVTGAADFAGRFLADSPDSAVVVTSSYNTYFCALAYQATHPGKSEQIVNIYNWDHQWGRDETDKQLDLSSQSILTRESYYANLITQNFKKRPVYIEYDQASAPITRYLIPRGMGYLFVVPDSSVSVPQVVSDSAYLSMASASNDLETIRTWVLWIQNRGEYYKARGNQEAAVRFSSLIDTLASKANLQ